MPQNVKVRRLNRETSELRDSDDSLRNRATMAVAQISQMYPNSPTAKIVDGDNDFRYEELIQSWVNALRTVSNAQLQQGLERLIESGDQFEPSMPAFIRMCRGNKISAGMYKQQKQLEHSADPKAPASIKHYPKHIRDELIRIELVPMKGETKHAYAERCKASTKREGIVGSLLRAGVDRLKKNKRSLSEREDYQRDYSGEG